MPFPKPPPGLVEQFDALIAGLPAERRQMFGCPCAFARAQMFCGVFGDRVFVRLPEADRAQLLEREGTEPFDPIGGRPMREYVVFSPELLEDETEARRWIERGLAYARSLPAKKRKVRAPGRAAARARRR